MKIKYFLILFLILFLVSFLFSFSSFAESPDEFFQQAKKIEKKDVIKAIYFYSEAIRFSDDSWKKRARCFVKRGILYYDLKDYRKSILDLKAAIDLDDENMDAHKYAAKCLYYLDKLNVAMQELERASEIDPRDGEIDFIKGRILLIICRKATVDLQPNILNSSLEAFTKAISNKRKYFEAYYYRALANAVGGFHEESLKDIKKAIKINKKYVPAWFELGKVHLVNKHDMKAFTAFEKCIKLDETFFPALDKLLKIAYQRKFTDKIKKYLKIALEHYPVNPFFRYLNKIYSVVPGDSLPEMPKKKIVSNRHEKKKEVKPESTWLEIEEYEAEVDVQEDDVRLEMTVSPGLERNSYENTNQRDPNLKKKEPDVVVPHEEAVKPEKEQDTFGSNNWY